MADKLPRCVVRQLWPGILAEYTRGSVPIEYNADTRPVERTPHCSQIIGDRRALSSLEVLDGAKRDACSFRELALRPPQPCSCCPTLFRGKHLAYITLRQINCLTWWMLSHTF